uniref:60S ribosomal export protein NMD3 n=1 Tax=Homalodisca liturata TaxID=320908 RepID=A0A1B6I271_9HEMI
MEYISPAESSSANVLCCSCGDVIEPNPAYMCAACLRSRVDITADIPKQATLYFCRGCERYLKPPNEWVACALESREMLSLCLGRVKGLNRVKLVDAGFVWTEPHSRRVKVKLTVQGEVIGATILQQVFVVEFTINHQMCSDCHRSEAQDFWRCLVQVRQKANSKKTFYYLEQLILKHKAHENTLGIKPVHDGLDFFFATEQHARKMVSFLTAVLPCRTETSKKLQSHDMHSNIYSYKFTYSVEIVPVTRDSLVCLSRSLCNQLGGISPLCLIYKYTAHVHLIDPSTGQIAEIDNTSYWRNPFNNICDSRRLVEYVVMDIEVIRDKDKKYFPGMGATSHKHALADVWVIKASEIGSDNTIFTRTHLGHVLKPGDSVLGYAVGESNINDANFNKLNTDGVADVILVKKMYTDRAARKKRRKWQLKHLPLEEDAHPYSEEKDYEEFLAELEEEPATRQQINIYKDPLKFKQPPIAVDADDQADPSVPDITLEEMLDDLTIDDADMAEVYE